MTWAQGILTLQPGVSALVADAHPIFKLHLFLGMTIFLVFPFTRLVHVWSAPVWYLGRRGYQVVRERARRAATGRCARPERRSGGVTAMTCSATSDRPAERQRRARQRRRRSRAIVICPRGAASPARRRRSRPGRRRRGRWSCANCCCRRRAGSSVAAEPLARRRRPARDRRGGRRPRAGRTRGAHAGGRRGDAAGAITSRTARRFRSPDIYEAAHILFARSQGRRARPTRRRTRMPQRCWRRCSANPERFAELAQAHSACPVGGAGRQSRPDHAGQTTPEFEAGAGRAGAGSDRARSRSRPATACTSSVSIASTKARELPFELVPTSTSPNICTRKRADGGPRGAICAPGLAERRAYRRNVDLARATADVP